MNLSISNITTPSNDEWDTIWKTCNWATYFHSRQWAELWEAYTSKKIIPHAQLITFSDNKQALLPFSLRKRGKGYIKEYLSSPGGTYGGPIANASLEDDHYQLLSNFIKKTYKTITLRLNPYCPNFSLPASKETIQDTTHQLNLKEGFDAIYNSFNRGNRSSINKAAKENLSITTASTENEWKHYFELYQASLKRWGETATSHYTWALFKILSAKQSPYVKLWFVHHANIPIAGAIILYAKKNAIYWHGATKQEYFQLRPMNLLMAKIIEHICNQDYETFDFNPSGGHEGAAQFKESFGAIKVDCPVIQKKHLTTKLINIYSRLRQKLS